MSLFLAPRSRPVIYTPEYTSEVHSSKSLKDTVKKNNLKDTGKRILSDNIPVIRKIAGNAKAFSCPGVQRIEWAYVRDISEQYGLQSFTILPWYTKAILVTVTGKYYMGAYTQDTIVDAANKILPGLGSETLIKWIRTELSRVDDSLTGATSSGSFDSTVLSQLRVGADNDNDGIEIVGFIKQFSIIEEVDLPFVQSYTLKYLGVDKEWYTKDVANARYKKDK